MSYKIYKFGGASVKDADGIRNLQHILSLHNGEEKLVVVISAMGKTTNLMEQILDAWYYNKEELPQLCQTLKINHYQVAYDLGGNSAEIIAQLNRFFDKLMQILSEGHSDNYDFDYDRIVSFGEYLSTTIISVFLNQMGVHNHWVDACKIIRTDNTYREGRVNWEVTSQEVKKQVETIEQTDNSKPIIITQGFIAGTSEKLRTTLGREGSDYTAAIIAYSLDAKDVTIWKDVPGLLNADPKLFPDAVKLDAIPYREAIELSYYGASVIHPKTLKPLRDKQIPLYVKSFFQPEEPGSIIKMMKEQTKIPSFIVKKDQILLTIFPKDFSFIAEENLTEIFQSFTECRIKINLMQSSALSFSVCIDNKPQRFQSLKSLLSKNYNIKYNDKVELITIRHYNKESIKKVLQNRTPILEQKSRTTLQLIIKI
jgi:aspartate kinase